MKREDYPQIKAIFQSALDIAPDERAAFLDEACAGNKDLRREVERLLGSYDSEFLEAPAVAGLADVVVEEERSEDEPTKILSDEESNPTKILPDVQLQGPPDENALRPSRLRIVLVCLLFVFAVGVNVISTAQVLSIEITYPVREAAWKGSRWIVVAVDSDSPIPIKAGDEIVSINNRSIDKRDHQIVLNSVKAGELYTLQIKREGEEELRDVAILAQPVSYAFSLTNYLLNILLPAVFLFTGLVVFLFKPNDKQALVMAVLFMLTSIVITGGTAYIFEIPKFFGFWWRAGTVASQFALALLIHLFLVFPTRLPILRRFPKLEWLIYLPVLLYGVPLSLISQMTYEGWTQLNSFRESPTMGVITALIVAFYLLGALATSIFNYIKAEAADKRRIRVVVAGFILALFPFCLGFLVLIPLKLLFNIDLITPLGDWVDLIFGISWVLMPITFAYGIARHKVIPVSFVIRRGLQYVLAKNALRVLLILPLLGIVWNIVADPHRTLNEIFLQNSLSFYFFIFFAAVLLLINRFGLREWIDRKFFREQYDQEKVLRDLTEAVKESDSLVKLSRLVSSKIQAALHPSSVFLFFQEDRNSDFSLSYTTSATGAATKLAADSPLLRFMQKERGAMEFPTRGTDELPDHEKRWLRDINANLLVPMYGSDGKLAGLFSLGEKLSQIPYTTRDKEMLGTLANQIALVHENLNLKDRMRREQKIKTEVLSRFDEGNINLLKECPKCGRCFDRNDETCPEDNSELNFSLPVERTIEDRYRLEKLIGKGGMGAVYEATDLRINRAVAIKILSGGMFGNKDALRRFEREAQTAGGLHHHNIVTVFDYGVLSTEGAFLVMELISGESLGEVLNRMGKLDPALISDWFSQVLDGVEVAHKAGIIHRDLKPENIFVSLNETGGTRLCILDFGLARICETEIAAAGNVTVPGTVIGTFGYMPSEQLRGEKVDERTDLFAVAVMIYEALHGAKPFAGKSYHELLTAMINGIELDSDKYLPDFFERGLANKPEKRFASAAEMKHSLTGAVSALLK